MPSESGGGAPPKRHRQKIVALIGIAVILTSAVRGIISSTDYRQNWMLLSKETAAISILTDGTLPNHFFPIYVPDLNESVRVNISAGLGQRDLTRYLYQRMLTYPGRTTDRNQADFWFIPGEESCPNRGSCYRARMKFNAELNPSNDTTVLLAASSRPNRFFVWFRKDQANNSYYKITPENYWHVPGQNWIGVPYVTSELLPCQKEMTTAATTTDPTPRIRTHRIACSISKKVTRIARQTRNALLEFCPTHSGVEFVPPNISGPGYIDLYARTEFSFQPMGDSFARKGIFDALRSGNIPIIFNTKSFKYPYFVPFAEANNTILLYLPHYLKWPPTVGKMRRLTDYVLQNISQAQIERMQSRIHELQRVLHYSSCETAWGDDDALWHLLKKLKNKQHPPPEEEDDKN